MRRITHIVRRIHLTKGRQLPKGGGGKEAGNWKQEAGGQGTGAQDTGQGAGGTPPTAWTDKTWGRRTKFPPQKSKILGHRTKQKSIIIKVILLSSKP